MDNIFESDSRRIRNSDPSMVDEKIIHSYEKRIFDLRNLIEIGMSLSSNLDFQSLVESLLYSCIGQMFVERVAILLPVDIDDDNYYIHMSKGYDLIFDRQTIVMREHSPLVDFFNRNPFPVEFNRLQENSMLAEDLTLFKSLKPKLIVPMKSKSSLNGILIMGDKIDGSAFSHEELEFVHDLSKFAAIAVENSRLYLMATLDRMTRLYIHHYFQDRLYEEIKRSQRFSTPLSLLISDIDHFKKFNDTYGHQQGDSVLKETASLFRRNLRKIDIPARYGGEEFAVILPATELKNGVLVANRLRSIVDTHRFAGQSEPLHVTISIGIAEYDLVNGESNTDFIKRVDNALYRAKDAGRNRVAVVKNKNDEGQQ